jgi:hypothetical protein
MTSELTSYLAVLKAAYDYEPTSEDEIAIKEDQILFLLERADDEYVLKLSCSWWWKLMNICRDVKLVESKIKRRW